MAEHLKKDVGTIYYMHKKGLLKHLQIADPKEAFKPIEKRILHLVHNLNSRCNNPRDKKFKFYGGKGIKNFLTLEQIIFLWKRDKAARMKQPSMDRINSKGHYTLENCRYIEMEENIRLEHWGLDSLSDRHYSFNIKSEMGVSQPLK